MRTAYQTKSALLFFAVIFSIPLFARGQSVVGIENVPAEYREEIREVLLSGKISSDVNEEQFENFVDALSKKAYNANVTGADLTAARVEALGAAAITGFDTVNGGVQAQEPNESVLGLVVLLLVIGSFLVWRWRKMYHGGALGSS